MTIEERLVDIEIKIARQEDLTDTLNRTIYEQQKKIGELEVLCTALARQLREMRDAAKDSAQAAPVNEKPPHY